MPLPQVVWDRADQLRELHVEFGRLGDSEVHALAWKSVVANIGDAPAGRRPKIEHQVDATAIKAVDRATAVDDLRLCARAAELPCGEAQRHENGIEGLGDSIQDRIVRR